MTPVNTYLTQQEQRMGKQAHLNARSANTTTHRTSHGSLVQRLMRALVSKDSRSHAAPSATAQPMPGEVI